MGKLSQSAPPEVRAMLSHLETIAHRHEYAQVFADFLQMAVCAFARETMEETYFQTIKRYNKKELDEFPKLLAEWLKATTKQRSVKGWFDALGMVYEQISSRYKSQALGQFFTPPPVCDLMARMQAPQLKAPPPEPLKVNDPASGSGRTLLAFHSVCHYAVYYAQDLDRICCLMTALNMMLHGMKGFVIWGNTLSMEERQTWMINNDLHHSGQLSILHMDEAQAPTKEPPEPETTGREQEPEPQEPPQQLTLLF